MAVGKQGEVMNQVRLVPLSEDYDPPDYAERSEIERLREQIHGNTEMIARLSKYVPPVAERRKRQWRVACEFSGAAIAATGAWWIYPPAALLLVGAWLLGDVIVSRRNSTDAG